jgi:hypothetical protein
MGAEADQKGASRMFEVLDVRGDVTPTTKLGHIMLPREGGGQEVN